MAVCADPFEGSGPAVRALSVSFGKRCGGLVNFGWTRVTVLPGQSGWFESVGADELSPTFGAVFLPPDCQSPEIELLMGAAPGSTPGVTETRTPAVDRVVAVDLCGNGVCDTNVPCGGVEGSTSFLCSEQNCPQDCECRPPSNLAASGITSTSAVLSWAASPSSVQSYSVYSRPLSSPRWVTATSSGLSYPLTNLLPGTTYEFSVFARCSAQLVSSTVSGTFTTAPSAPEPVCGDSVCAPSEEGWCFDCPVPCGPNGELCFQ
jgi:hypothetical protein